MCLAKPTHAHTLSLFLCLSAVLLFSPFFLFDIKTLATILSLSIEIQISTYSLVLISKGIFNTKLFVHILSNGEKKFETLAKVVDIINNGVKIRWSECPWQASLA
jgi:hypothetical protein